MESKIKEDFEFAEELFAPLNEEERKLETIVRPSVGYWKDAWRRLKANKVALISLIIILLVILLAIIKAQRFSIFLVQMQLEEIYLLE